MPVLKRIVAFTVCLVLSSCTASQTQVNPVRDISSKASIDTDSVRILIRRGMTDEASSLLESISSSIPKAEFHELSAMICEQQEAWSAAADHWRHATGFAMDSVRYRIKWWSGLLKSAGNDSLNRAEAINQIRMLAYPLQEGNSLQSLYLDYYAAMLLGDTTVTAKGDLLIQYFPDSDEANDLIGSRFWDGMYPIWTNDSAKVPYFHEFIQRYSQSDWAHYARRNLIASYLALKDTASAFAQASSLVYFGNNAPLVLSQAVSAMYDIPQAADSVATWAQRAYDKRSLLTRPSYYSPPEWALIETATRAGFPLTLAGIYLKEATPPTPPSIEGGNSPDQNENLALARHYAEESHNLAVYDIDDNNTTAPQHFMLGRIALAEGDSTEAAEWWIEAAIDGDVYNRFAGRAVDSLKAMRRLNTENTESTENTEKEFLDYCRKIANYKGITFDRVTKEVGLDSARGSRVAWGDYDGDGDDDLLAGGSRLFRNPNINIQADLTRIFEDVSESVMLNAEGCHGGIWGKVFGEYGTPDLFCFSSSSDRGNAERLYWNQPGGWFGDTPAETTKTDSGDYISWVHWDGEPQPSVRWFVDKTYISPSLPDSFSTEAAIWFDANGDGRLDLYIPGYERPAKGADDLGNAWPSRLMIQVYSKSYPADSGGEWGVFCDSTEAFGLVPKDGRWFCARSPVACDFDRDGDQDLYVGNYRLQENQFWVNNANSASRLPSVVDGEFPQAVNHRGLTAFNPPFRFSNLAAYYQIDGEEKDGWFGHTIGCQWGDFDGDGDFDLIACNLAHPRYIGFSNRAMLYRNDLVASTIVDATGKEPPFKNVQREWGIKYEECHSEPVFGDFDNDGDLDLFITCVYPNRRSFLYENKGDRFVDVTFLSGVRIFNGWGCATSDYDNDGRLDLAVCEGGKIELFRNTTKNGGNWIEIAPDPTPGEHLSQIGGIVEIEAGGRKYIRQFEGGKGAGSQNSGVLHFGIGKETTCNVVLSNRGKTIVFDRVAVNQKFEIDEKTAVNGGN